MNKFVILIGLLCWIICTLILLCTIIGGLLFLPETFQYKENKSSTWMRIGTLLTEKLIE